MNITNSANIVKNKKKKTSYIFHLIIWAIICLVLKAFYRAIFPAIIKYFKNKKINGGDVLFFYHIIFLFVLH